MPPRTRKWAEHDYMLPEAQSLAGKVFDRIVRAEHVLEVEEEKDGWRGKGKRVYKLCGCSLLGGHRKKENKQIMTIFHCNAAKPLRPASRSSQLLLSSLLWLRSLPFLMLVCPLDIRFPLTLTHHPKTPRLSWPATRPSPQPITIFSRLELHYLEWWCYLR